MSVSIVTARPEHAAGLEELQRICFPTLGAHELMTAAHFLRHCEVYPEGEFVALEEGKIIGLGSGFLLDFHFDDPGHTFNEIIDSGWYSHHNPDGEWYYGTDISVHPDYRGLGIGKLLYAARKELVMRTNRRGIVAGGVLPGYPAQRARMSVHEYVEKVVVGELWDSTLSFQLKNGFKVRGMLENYIDDSASDNWATLICWENPAYRGE
ncbi:MAG: GNAT family N-acetyltransferase [Caldilineaceae bacterium]|nr:GNAT family N-acetyltransferase [Caldilineaceae bacterium]